LVSASSPDSNGIELPTRPTSLRSFPDISLAAELKRRGWLVDCRLFTTNLPGVLDVRIKELKVEEFLDLIFVQTGRKIYYGGPTKYKLLQALLEHFPRCAGYDELVGLSYDERDIEDVPPNPQVVVRAHIWGLRRLLALSGWTIENFAGFGYRLVEPSNSEAETGKRST
jgi:DNA-binding winged helix-turn-helix (wHTH) protein